MTCTVNLSYFTYLSYISLNINSSIAAKRTESADQEHVTWSEVCGIMFMCSGCLSHSCEHDVSGEPVGNFFK